MALIPDWSAKQFIDDVTIWIRDESKRQDDADRRTRDLIAVHREGWKQAADAILKGFGLVADAIRASSR